MEKKVSADVMEGSQEEILLDLRYPMPGVWKEKGEGDLEARRGKARVVRGVGLAVLLPQARKQQEPLKLEEEREHSPLGPSEGTWLW